MLQAEIICYPSPPFCAIETVTDLQLFAGLSVFWFKSNYLNN